MADNYLMKLRDPKWKERADQIRVARKHTCEVCGTKDAYMHVHHIYYDKNKEPWEYDDECYACLCPNCHSVVHKEVKKVSSLLALAAVKNNFDYMKVYSCLKAGRIL